MITAGYGVQHQLGPVGNLGPAGQHPRVVALGVRIPGHDRHVTRRATRVDAGAGVVGDLAQDRGDSLVGEAETDPYQMAVHQPGQDVGQLADVGPAVLRGSQHDAVGAVVLAVGEQHREFGLAEHVTGPPAVKAQLVFPGGEAGRGGAGADPDAGVDDAGVVVRGHYGLERAAADQFLARRPGPAGFRVGAGRAAPDAALLGRPVPRAAGG